jgi:hypothetical protein
MTHKKEVPSSGNYLAIIKSAGVPSGFIRTFDDAVELVLSSE